ncbi:DUF2157 domain-containing protein [Pedobacter sp. PLR]|uniref:DUF2157 domain-containing protein n=1 Tax=Pedobacter sp. PLR TaxID=2994465 RepID=UPI002245BC23|nr:DUF2157 domain-containing protein [Pedobacter sp. PLR]MCX2452984.1 DUF2157 domain-containing protein [Pedobacter sp. PLR]
MIPDDLYKTLKDNGTISSGSFEKMTEKQRSPLFSLHWELKTLLYLGVMMLSCGSGILIYKNIDTIGHQAILAFIAAICGGCFYYCFRNKKPFSRELIKAPDVLFDYLLLLGCLSFLTFTGYLQYQYQVFGTHYGMATFIPMVVLFYVAYEFDHLGVLSMAIANLAVWMGVSVTPNRLLSNANFDNQTLIYTYLLLGLILLLAGFFSERFSFKKHFRFSYFHFGIHISFIALVFAYFNNYDSGMAIIWLLILFALAFYLYLDALHHKSFYFMLLVILYSYAAVSILVFRSLDGMSNMGGLYLLCLYFIISAAALILRIIRLNKQIKAS